MPSFQLKLISDHEPFPPEKAIAFGYAEGVWIAVFTETGNVVTLPFGKQGKYESKTDEELLKMHLDADQRAFEVFFNRHEIRLKKVLFKASYGRADLVDPLFSDFMTAFFERLAEGKEAFVQQMLPNISAYMSAWARNSVRDYFRSKTSKQEAATVSLSIVLDDEEGDGIQRDIADEHTSATERFRDLYECLSSLIWAQAFSLEREVMQARSETDRKRLIHEKNKHSREASLLENILKLMVFYGFTQEQVADKLQKDRKTIRQRGERIATIYRECAA